MSTSKENVSARQAAYYGDLYERHGSSVDAVASASQAFKEERYERLTRVFGDDPSFTIHDVGCGLGHLYEFIRHRYPSRAIEYSGSEITPGFVDHCQRHYPDLSFELRDLSVSSFPEKYDYLIFAGTFYHLANSNEDEFRDFIRRMLSNGFACANKGIAFNLITSHVDYRLPDLYYADLGDLTTFIARKLSRFFTVDHASPLFEYTVCVYKPAFVRKLNSNSGFDKYFRAS